MSFGDGLPRRRIAQFIFLALFGFFFLLLLQELRNNNTGGIVTYSLFAFLVIYFFFLITRVDMTDNSLKFFLIIPATILLFLVSIFPFIYAVVASFFKIGGANLRRAWPFVGFSNYVSLFTDPLFWDVLARTIEYLLVAVTLELVIGLLMALLLNKVRGMFSNIFVIPMMVAPIAVALLWKAMLTEQGFINAFLHSVGLPEPVWLSYREVIYPFLSLPPFYLELARKLNMTYGFFAILIPDIWQWTPLVALFILTGIKSLPPDIIEAAEVEGASSRQILSHIILPLLRPVIGVTILIRVIDVFKVYEYIWATFREGIGVRTLNVQLTVLLFRTHEFGKASALAVLTLLIVSALTMVFYRTVYARTEKL